MTQVWDDQHRAIPVTVVRVSPARVVQVKTPEKEGYSAAPGHLGHAARLDPLQARARPLRQGRRRRRARSSSSCASTTCPATRSARRSSPTSSRRASTIDATAISKGKGFAGGDEAPQLQGPGRGPRQPQAPPRARVDRRLRDARTRLQGHARWPGAWAAARSRRPTSRSIARRRRAPPRPGQGRGARPARRRRRAAHAREEPDEGRRRAMSETSPCADRSRRTAPRPRERSVTRRTPRPAPSSAPSPSSRRIFGIEPNVAVLHQVITAQLAAKRAGTQSTKTRNEVRGGGAQALPPEGHRRRAPGHDPRAALPGRWRRARTQAPLATPSAPPRR